MSGGLLLLVYNVHITLFDRLNFLQAGDVTVDLKTKTKKKMFLRSEDNLEVSV